MVQYLAQRLTAHVRCARNIVFVSVLAMFFLLSSDVFITIRLVLSTPERERTPIWLAIGFMPFRHGTSSSVCISHP